MLHSLIMNVTLCSVPVELPGSKMLRERGEGDGGVRPKTAICSLNMWSKQNGFGACKYYDIDMLYPSDEDVENNLLRGSISAMAGAIGGVDELTIPSFDQSDSINSFRLSDNIQHMLKEESNIHWISNAPEGSYYLNYLTNEIIDKSWSFFQKIEALGGYSKLPSTNLSSWLKNSADALCQLVNSDQLKVIGITVYNDSKRQLNYNGEKFNWR